MAGKGKIVRGALAALHEELWSKVLVDAYKKTFDPKTYYHYSDSPDIKKFNPKAEDSWSSGQYGQLEPTTRGATYFTSDPQHAEGIFKEKLQVPESKSGNYPKDYFEDYVESFPAGGAAPTTYPVKIKTDEIFDYKNESQIEDLIGEIEKLSDKLSNDEYRSLVRIAWENLAGSRYGGLGGVISLVRRGRWEVLETLPIQKIMKEKGYRGYTTNEPGTVGLFNPDKGDVRSIFAKFDPKKWKSGNILASVPAAGLMALGGAGALSNLVDEQ